MNLPPFRSIITVTLNPTIDRVIEVPGFHLGGHLRGTLHFRQPAGKAINVSVAMARLGIKNTAIGWVGMHTFDLFSEALEKSGVRACFIPIAGETRENITIIDPTGGSETHIRDAGPTITPSDMTRLTDLLRSLCTPDTMVVFTGSLPPGMTMAQWEQCLDICLEKQSRLVLDTAGEPLKLGRRKSLWMIKPNELELADLVDFPIDSDEAVIEAGRQLNREIPIVLITLGARGAYCFTDQKVMTGKASLPAEQVKSTVGCGDVMLAGFLAAHANGATAEQALHQGLAVSAAAAGTEQPATFEMDEVQALHQRTEIHHL